MPSGREWERALDDLYGWACGHLDEGNLHMEAAEALLARARVEREAALAARSVVERWLVSDDDSPDAAASVADALHALNKGPFDKRLLRILACYDAYCLAQPMPEGTPEVVGVLCEALARMAVEEVGREGP